MLEVFCHHLTYMMSWQAEGELTWFQGYTLENILSGTTYGGCPAKIELGLEFVRFSFSFN